MARPLRIEFPGAVYHVTSRGNERKPIFKDDQDRKILLDILADVTLRYNWLCHAYCLMDNHYHLLIDTPDGNLSIGMRQLNGIYTQRFNKRHGRVGHLFQGRFKAVLVQKDSHLLEVCRYVVLNPIRAGIVQRPEEWIWSSYGATAGQAKLHPCLVTGWVLSQFDSERKIAEAGYRKFVREGIEAESIWNRMRGQSVLGEDEFIESLSDYVRGRRQIPEIAKSQRFMNKPPLGGIFRPEVLGDRQKRDKTIAKAVFEHGYTQREVADYLRIHFTSVSRILRAKDKMLRK
ncbi:MAG: transposase [Deltaproteobacteria bacterium]|nr:transposase [Deltaproteobacteria bacterium]MBM4324232.1 transposase [Deltaproteobacteria bacterium]